MTAIWQPSDFELGAGCDTWYVQPHCDEQLGVAHGVHPSSLQQALDAARSAGKCVTAVLVVSPTYFGVCSDISGTACTLITCLAVSLALCHLSSYTLLWWRELPEHSQSDAVCLAPHAWAQACHVPGLHIWNIYIVGFRVSSSWAVVCTWCQGICINVVHDIGCWCKVSLELVTALTLCMMYVCASSDPITCMWNVPYLHEIIAQNWIQTRVRNQLS